MQPPQMSFLANKQRTHVYHGVGCDPEQRGPFSNALDFGWSFLPIHLFKLGQRPLKADTTLLQFATSFSLLHTEPSHNREINVVCSIYLHAEQLHV